MSFLVLLGLALALAMDAFAVSLGLGVSRDRFSSLQTLRLSLSFGIFQFLMPVIGWGVGTTVVGLIDRYDHWVAFILLVGVGGRMGYQSLYPGKTIPVRRSDPTRGFSLFILSVATSLDALAVGLSLAALHVAILYPAVVIGIVAFLMTVIGMKLGPLFGRAAGKRAELVGGLLLILIGVKILTDHL